MKKGQTLKSEIQIEMSLLSLLSHFQRMWTLIIGMRKNRVYNTFRKYIILSGFKNLNLIGVTIFISLFYDNNEFLKLLL